MYTNNTYILNIFIYRIMSKPLHVSISIKTQHNFKTEFNKLYAYILFCKVYACAYIFAAAVASFTILIPYCITLLLLLASTDCINTLLYYLIIVVSLYYLIIITLLLLSVLPYLYCITLLLLSATTDCINLIILKNINFRFIIYIYITNLMRAHEFHMGATYGCHIWAPHMGVTWPTLYGTVTHTVGQVIRDCTVTGLCKIQICLDNCK